MRLCILMCFAVLLTASAAIGQETSIDEQQFSRLSDTTLKKLLADAKYEYSRKETITKGKTVVVYTVTFTDGLKGTLINHGTALSIWSLGFKTAAKEDISLERVNEWNKKSLFTKAFVTANGDGIVTGTINLADGTNRKNLQGWMLDYSFELKKFAEFVR